MHSTFLRPCQPTHGRAVPATPHWLHEASHFDGLHSRRHDEEVQLYAFDILALDVLPLSLRIDKVHRS